MKRSRKTGAARKLPLRRKIRNVRIIARIVLPLIVLAAIGVLLYRDIKGYLNASERYRVERIEVTGANRVSLDVIIAMSGIHKEGPIFSIERTGAAERISEHPRIRSATISITVPDRVSICVAERVPVALAVFDKAYELDTEGFILGEYDKELFPKGPIISGVKKREAPREGDQLQEDGVKEALELWRAFSSDPISKKLTVSEIDISESDSLIMILSKKRYEIRWPRENFPQCLARLNSLWQETGGLPKVRRYVDLRFDHSVPTR